MGPQTDRETLFYNIDTLEDINTTMIPNYTCTSRESTTIAPYPTLHHCGATI